ncbi:NfeD family protein [Sodalis ligni]|jgi:membrane protein implicated in regulation of membrane protease activity|uniref:NfeD family protein n=1 Tax=Sodalis TaxID=84565 RepID=UPI00193FADF0|nr:NfeD family protein [Sodalis ligni]QWA12482.1 NfeD family protein [Sodalis ligni]
MLTALVVNPHWFWISLGGLLLAAEMLGAGGFLLWSGCAAVAVGLVIWVVPMDWAAQGLLFALLTLVSGFLWWYWLRGHNKSLPASLLNRRGEQLVGIHAILVEPVVNGVGRVRVGDGTWRAICDEDLPVGATVEVMAAEGITLHVRPVSGSSSIPTDYQ